MIKKTQNNTTFGAKLTQNAIRTLKDNKNSINTQTKRAIRILRKDLNTNTATIDIITQRRRGKDVFSFTISPDPKSTGKLTPHHPYWKKDPKSPTGLKIMRRRNFFWKNLDEMFQNDILKPEKLKKVLDVWQEQHISLDKWLKSGTSARSSEYAGKTGQKTNELMHLTQVEK